MLIFNRYVTNYQRVHHFFWIHPKFCPPKFGWKLDLNNLFHASFRALRMRRVIRVRHFFFFFHGQISRISPTGPWFTYIQGLGRVAEYTYVISGCSRTEVNGEYVQQGKFCNQRPIFYCVAGADWTGMLRSWCSMEKRWNFKWADVMYLFLLLLLLVIGPKII